jgi:hypothetical protein
MRNKARGWQSARPTQRGLYWYRKQTGRIACALVERGTNGKLYATLLPRRGGWRPIKTYLVGAMGGHWYPLPRPPKEPPR